MQLALGEKHVTIADYILMAEMSEFAKKLKEVRSDLLQCVIFWQFFNHFFGTVSINFFIPNLVYFRVVAYRFEFFFFVSVAG